MTVVATRDSAAPLVSVIVPAYNAEAFIVDAIESALLQTMTDLEVIVADDGSTDGTLRQLSRFSGQIRLTSNHNLGVARARNLAATLARGTWLAFLDADDVWLPQKLERQLARAEAGTALVYSNRFNIGDRGDVPELQTDVTPMHEGDIFVRLLLEGNFITSSSVVVKRDVFEEYGGFYEGLTASEDWDLWIRVASQHPIALVREPLLRYRFHQSSLSHAYDSMWQQRRRVIQRALDLPRGRTLSKSVRRRIWARTFWSNAAEAVRASRKLDAARQFGQSLMAWPFNAGPYRELAKLMLGESRIGQILAAANRRLKSTDANAGRGA